MGIPKPKEFRIRHPRVHLTGKTFIIIFLIFYFIGWSVTSFQKDIYNQNRAKRLAETVDFCKTLFTDSIVKEGATEDELKDCENRLDETEEQSETISALKQDVNDAFNYLNWEKNANSWFDENNIVKDSINEQDLASIHESAEKLAEKYREIIAEKRNKLQSEYDKMKDVENLVNGLFTSIDRADVNPNVNRGGYDDARNRVNELAQESLKNRLNESLDKVLPVIEEKERIAREQAEAARRAREEEARKIRESQHDLNIGPWYVNQWPSGGLINGCEAASLLMAAKYKGYARNYDFRTFAFGMPEAVNDNPETGFVGALDNNDGDKTHWIAPAPLARYGQSKGISVTNVSGASLDALDQEVANGNPVVIYLTYNFRDPRDYNNGVPRNLHVLVLSGFNSYTGLQTFYDPLGSSSPVTVSKARVQQLYAASGYRALVVK